MNSRHISALAVGITACVVLGAAAGVDAGGHVDGFYTTPPIHEARAPAVPQSSPYDWDQPPPSDTTWASATAGQSVAIVGTDRPDGSDLAEIDRAVERAGPVRVHRPRRARVGSLAEPPEPADDGPADVDGDSTPTA